MQKRSIRADYSNKFLNEVAKLYFEGVPLMVSIDKASNVLYPEAKGRVRKWLKKNF